MSQETTPNGTDRIVIGQWRTDRGIDFDVTKIVVIGIYKEVKYTFATNCDTVGCSLPPAGSMVMFNDSAFSM